MKNRGFYVHLRTWAEREGVRLVERNAKWNTRSLLGEKRTTTADVIYLDGKAPAEAALDDNDRESRRPPAGGASLSEAPKVPTSGTREPDGQVFVSDFGPIDPAAPPPWL